MKVVLKYIIIIFVIIGLWAVIWPTNASVDNKYKFQNYSYLFDLPDEPDSMKYPFTEPKGYPFSNSEFVSPLYLGQPENITEEVEYNTETNSYEFYEKIGDMNYRNPTTMSIDEYRKYDFNRSIRSYWRQRARGENSEHHSSLIPKLHVGGEVFDKIFGSNTIDIRPQGSAELIFGLKISKTDNPQLAEKLRSTTTFDFQEKIQMNVTGQIGDKMKLGINYNTEATFDFENKMNLAYEGKEDDIIQKIEAGDVTLPLSGSLITGSQSLFGIKTELRFGRLTATTIFSQQKGKTSVIEVEGGAQTSEFEVYADEYEANKHFFLSQYFYNNYDRSLANLPIINSGINITRIEVWITNKTARYDQSRNIVGFMDLAEYNTIYSSAVNPYYNPENPNLYPTDSLNSINDVKDDPLVREIDQASIYLEGLGYRNGIDFEKIESARKLSPSEYVLNSKLGYISLSSSLNSDEVLSVAYEYTVGGKTYRVGEFSNSGIDAPDVLIVKLLKGTSLTPRYPTWNLMMKNVYAIGAYRINPAEFYLEVMYQNDKTGKAINFLPVGNIEDKILLKVLNLDKLNSQLDPHPDGVFDFVEGVTINSSNGRIFFPVLEPFGEFLREQIKNGDESLDDEASEYVFEELYDSTQSKARQVAEKNKFYILGTYQSSSGSDISLNALNIPQGSVNVTAGGIQLVENQDYTVDYTLGRVKIINQGLLESGTPIRISLESNSLFNIQSKTLLGTHLDYRVSNDFNIGATILNLTERPLTQKVNIGDEPISNTIWGINGTYRTESGFITKMIDKLPFIETKAKSTITIEGEFAHLIPGHSKAIEKSGVSYIDDFEGSKTSMDIKSMGAWVLSSTPQKQSLFPESNVSAIIDSNDARAYGANRAKLSWYIIDPLFLRNNSITPDHIKNSDEQNNHFVREIFEKEIFPFKESPQNVPTNLAVLNLAFYPKAKGPYNYDVEESYDGGTLLTYGIDANGQLKQPKTRWAGIMRRIETNDFEAANIEFIEFWMMDPFVYDTAHTGGQLYFNLGDISEDILKDSRKMFENGLPTTDQIELIDTTYWGRVPKTQSLVNAFDNNEESRQYQDVGLDGLSDDDENSFFASYIEATSLILNPEAQNKILNDPSSDNYHYFRGSDYDDGEVSILDRYSLYNGLDGNSPTSTQSDESYPTSATSQPNTEDVNRDNTLSEAENYYQYKVNLISDQMLVGKNYITDVIEGSNKDGDKVKWYQFKIPVYSPDEVYGEIQDFKSIRFMRIFLKGFEDNVVLRFATMDLVRGEWRKYNFSLREAGLYLPGDPAGGSFDISAVNIEENGYRSPINYILPPGISRVIDPTNPQLRQLNEQSISLKVTNLADGDARAAYKNVDMDLRQYKRLQMFVHAEETDESTLSDDDLTVFIRLGSDYQNNYYEYEIPLKVTLPGSYEQNDNLEHEDRYKVWPEKNAFNIQFELLQKVKQNRNNEIRRAGTELTYSDPYYLMDEENKITIVGNPNLSNIRTIMIGIRNRKKENNELDDDGMSKSAEVWMNELRLTDFNEKGGWAANARITTRLADFGTLTVAGSTSKPGFGSIEKKVSERSQEEIYQYDIASNLELGRFFPEKMNIKVPMYLGYSEGFINPEYNPLDPDIPLKVTLNDSLLSKDEKDSIRSIAQEYTRRRSLNFTNVKIGKGKGKPHIYDISNVALTYSYNELNSHNISTEYNDRKTYRGALTYNYNSSAKTITPFKSTKIKLLKKPALRIIKDFNFNLMPSQISFMTDMNRMYNQKKLRNISNPDILIEPTYNKDFTWNRIYDFRYDITRSLKFDFSANNHARIDEPEGLVTKDSVETYELWKDSVMSNIRNFGRNTQYHHQYNINYSIPINKIPLFNWITASARYSGNYDWVVGPTTADTIMLGNTIKNSNTAQLNGQLNMINLYNKIGFLKKVNQKYRSRGRNRKPEIKTEKVFYPKKGDPPKEIDLKEDMPKIIYHKLMTDDITVKILDSSGVEIKGKIKILTDNKISFTIDDDYKNATVAIEGTREIKESLFKKIMERTALVMMSVKNFSVSYNQSEGTFLPGYLPKTNILGRENYNGTFAPDWQFVMGIQDPNFAQRASEMGWITTDASLNNAVTMSHTNNLNLRSSIEPIKGFRIDVTANRSYSQNVTEYWVADEFGNFPEDPYDRSRMVSGNFNMSYNTWNTAFFRRMKNGDYFSQTFQEFADNRIIIAQRLAQKRADAQGQQSPYFYNPNLEGIDGFPDGYSSTSQEVLIPALLAAYSGKDANHVGLNIFPTIPMPNWRITYDGLAKIKFVKRYFKKVSFGHSFRSSYAVNSYTTNLYYQEGRDGMNWVRDNLQEQQALASGNFLAEREINTVSITEQFSPLASIDMTWNNSLITKFEIKKTRNLNFSFSNNQLIEVTGDDYIIGGGYRFNKVKINFVSLNGNKTKLESDLNLRADLSFRKQLTFIRKLVEDYSDLTTGQSIVTLKLTADYVLSDRFNLRLFFDRVLNKPYTSVAFRRVNTNFGVSVRFTLAG